MSTKKENKRLGRKNATKIRNWFSALLKDEIVKRDGMSASQRCHGLGKSR